MDGIYIAGSCIILVFLAVDYGAGLAAAAQAADELAEAHQ